LQIVILITNSQSQNTPTLAGLDVANNLTNDGAKVFVYDLNPKPLSTWESFACADGSDPNLVSVNPLLWLSSYFSFLARARIAVSSAKVFWQNPYIDSSYLGEVITVAYPGKWPQPPVLSFLIYSYLSSSLIFVDCSEIKTLTFTNSFAAMSADGLQLIGVAGIDVQTAGLQSDALLKQEVETLLTSSNYGQIATNPNAGVLAGVCSTVSCPNSSLKA
jgi:hypothetical protein